MLYAVAWPLLSEADDTALRRLRAQYHPQEAKLIGPHFTLGLLASALEAEQVARIVERRHLPIRGRVEELALLRRSGDRLEAIATVALAR